MFVPLVLDGGVLIPGGDPIAARPGASDGVQKSREHFPRFLRRAGSRLMSRSGAFWRPPDALGIHPVTTASYQSHRRDGSYGMQDPVRFNSV